MLTMESLVDELKKNNKRLIIFAVGRDGTKQSLLNIIPENILELFKIDIGLIDVEPPAS